MPATAQLPGYHVGDQTLLAQPPELIRLLIGNAREVKPPEEVDVAIASVARLFETEGYQLARNYRLGTGDDQRDHVDFMVGHCAVIIDFPIHEQGPRFSGQELARRLEHYAKSSLVNTLLVVTSRDLPKGTTDESNGKRIFFWTWR